MDLPVYNMTFSEENEGGLIGISLVNSPANRTNFITLSEDFVRLKTDNEEKQIVSGVVLIPNQMIYRNDPKHGEHFITFDEETIEQLCHTFLGSEYIKNSWFEHNHKERLNPIIVESWIIDNPELDKSISLGFKDLPKGTWMLSMKLSDKEWNEYIKTNKVKGFSIDAYLDRKLILKKENEMENIMKRLITMLNNHKVNLATIEVGEKVLTAESFEEGKVVKNEGVLFVNESFEYMGHTYTTNDEGVITSVVEVKEDEIATEELVTEDEIQDKVEDKVEEKGEDTEEIPIEVVIEIVKEIIEEEPLLDEYLRKHYGNKADVQLKLTKLFSEERDTLNTKITELENKIVELNKELEITPATTKLSANSKETTKPRYLETELEAIARIVQLNKTK